MSNAHVTNISSLEQLQQEEPNFNTVDWDNLNRMKYMRGRMVPDCWHMKVLICLVNYGIKVRSM